MPKLSRENPVTPVHFADYAASLTGDLALMAREHGLETLAHLLDMARLEAEAIVGRAATKAN